MSSNANAIGARTCGILAQQKRVTFGDVVDKKRLKSTDQVLRYRPTAISRSKVHRHYKRWREQHGIPRRCDMEGCQFGEQPLIWRNDELPLILDHKNGNNLDNSPENLRYVCPNCNSQLPTYGGRNRGRVVEATEGKYILRRDKSYKSCDYHQIPDPAQLQTTGLPPTLGVNGNGEDQG